MFSLLVAVGANGVGFFHLATVFAFDQLGENQFDTGAAFALAAGRPFAFG
jgi:hypothetical protein